MARLLVGWTQLFGLISFELFGQTNNVITAHDDLFDSAAAAIARFIGLVRPTSSTDSASADAVRSVRRALTQSSASRQRASACSRALCASSPAAGIRTEELDAALLGVQGTQRVGHQFVGDVRLGVDDEAVVAEPAGLDGAG